MKYSDKSIVKGIKEKDNNVLSHLYSEYQTKVINYVILNSGKREDGEDIFHDTIIKLYREVNKEKFELNSSFDVYFTALYKNTWRYNVKLNKRYVFTEFFIESTNVEYEEDYIDYKKQKMQSLIINKFSLLKNDCQTVLKMYYQNNLTMNEIAQIKGYKNGQIARNKKYLCLENLKVLIKSSFKNK